MHARPSPSPRTLGGPAVPLVLGVGVLGGEALAAVCWNWIAGLILGVITLPWLLKQLWGEIQLEWECRRPVQAARPVEQVIQDLPELPARGAVLKRVPVRRAIEPVPPRVPIIAQAEVIEVKR